MTTAIVTPGESRMHQTKSFDCLKSMNCTDNNVNDQVMYNSFRVWAAVIQTRFPPLYHDDKVVQVFQYSGTNSNTSLFAML